MTRVWSRRWKYVGGYLSGERLRAGLMGRNDDDDDDVIMGDVEHISELIKRRCKAIKVGSADVVIRDEVSPDTAIRYSNLFSRLQAQVTEYPAPAN
jgi:hypothetical protein